MEPIPGKIYLVKEGDTLSKISIRAYGDVSQWPKIHRANLTVLKSDDPNLIFPGEEIIIPLLKKILPVIPGKNDLTFIIGGIEVITESARIVRTMDSAADSWAVRVPWEPGLDKAFDKATLPFSYAPSIFFIGNIVQGIGTLYSSNPIYNTNGRSKELESFSNTADIVDSTMPPPYEFNNITLGDLANELCSPLGISVKLQIRTGQLLELEDFGVDLGGPFDRATAESDETIFSFISRLAKARGYLASSSREGDLVFLIANTHSAPVGTIEEQTGGNFSQGSTEFRATFDGRKRFNAYKVNSNSPGGEAKTAVAKDSNVPKSRFKTIQADNNIEGELQSIANWERSKQIVEALTIPFPVVGWYAPNGKLWAENTTVTVKSKTISVPDGFTFLIRQVEFILENGGRSSILSLVPPEAYTGEVLTDPWS